MTQAVWLIIRRPSRLYFVLHHEEIYQQKVKKQFPEFAHGLPVIAMTDLCDPIHETIGTYSFLGGTSELSDLALLRILARKFESCRYFEIGTWRGESLHNLADITVERASLNLSAEQLRQKGYPEEEIAAQGFYLNDQTSFKQYFADSALFDFSLPGKQDLVFVDGDHHYAAVKSDSAQVCRHLVHSQSVIVWHDYKRHYSTIWWEVMLGILEGVPKNLHHRLCHVRNTNCAVLLPEAVSTKTESNPWLPQTDFQIEIRSK